MERAMAGQWNFACSRILVPVSASIFSTAVVTFVPRTVQVFLLLVLARWCLQLDCQCMVFAHTYVHAAVLTPGGHTRAVLAQPFTRGCCCWWQCPDQPEGDGCSAQGIWRSSSLSGTTWGTQE